MPRKKNKLDYIPINFIYNIIGFNDYPTMLRWINAESKNPQPEHDKKYYFWCKCSDGEGCNYKLVILTDYFPGTYQFGA